jgi:peptidyl-prolyl cis-trans isomerase-like 4
LQYAFIEFETTASCEEAYLKMENALIDDRRVHVDFCQSSAKQWAQLKKAQRRKKLLHDQRNTLK